MNQRSTEAVKVKAEALVTASITGHIDDETARWVAGLDKAMSDKLSRLGLIRQQRVLTLGEFVSMYVTSREDLKARTRELLEKAGENLVELFGKGKLLRDFTPGDADTFRQSLLNAGLAENTVRRRCGRAKQFFKAAMRQRLIPSNPFEGIACNVNENRSRFHFVSREDAAKVIEACPDQEWRVLFALARYGGLRCPSETLSLRWQDIDWQNQRMHVRSPKTEHHAGRESRLVPLLPELLPHLERAFELAEDGAEFVISRLIQNAPGDADAWRLSLIDQNLADNTIRRRCGRAKQFFKAAVRLRLIPENPFIDLKSSVQGNPDRLYFVTPDEAQRVLAACPDAEWRLIFALSRYGGLRCPSEHLALRWGDVNWEQGRVLVSSPKTEHLPGGESRTIPLFPQLRPFLEDAFELAEPGSEFVISRYRDGDKNLRTQLKRIVIKAGLNPWPKLFQNLRSSRETELVETFPLHVVCGWIGNSAPVAQKHYLQLTSEHFERALNEPEAIRPEAISAARNPARYMSELPGMGWNQKNEPLEIPLDSEGFQPVPGNKLPEAVSIRTGVSSS